MYKTSKLTVYQKKEDRIIILNNSESFANQMCDSNVVYVIKDVFDLEDKEGKHPVRIPRNCRFFQGGCLCNGVHWDSHQSSF